MGHDEKKLLPFSYEKSWWQSKKFIAFLLMEIMFCGMAVTALFTQPSLGWPLAAFMLGVVITMGFVGLSFNGKQAALDTYVRAMALTGGVPANLRDKLTIIAPESGPAAVTPDPDLNAEVE